MRPILGPHVRRAGWVVLLAALVLGSCGPPVSVTRQDPVASYARLNGSALSSDRPSESTLTVLRRHDLLNVWTTNQAAGIASLRAAVVGHPARWPELFALAELSYLRGRRAASQPDSLAAAIYAYAFLFPDDMAERPSPFDPHFRQACDIYNLGLTAAMTMPQGQSAKLVPGRYPLPFGSVDIAIDPQQLRWADRNLVSFQPTSNLKIEGMQNIYRDPGLGAPLAATTEVTTTVSKGLEVTPRLRVPVNALLLIDDPRRAVAQTQLTASLIVHAEPDASDMQIGGDTVPLEYHPTAARAFSLAVASAWSDEFRGFLNGNLFKQTPARLLALEPHERGRMPVILVHGTASSPLRWADMVNDLLSDPRIRDKFEFWFFSYATGNPIPYSALLLRQAIEATVAQLGGTAADPALGHMTLIGHSQGGLLIKMLVIDPGDTLWNGISRVPLDRLNLSPTSRALLRETLFVHPVPEVQRVIFMATPHRGSFLAGFSISRLVARLVTLPLAISEVAKDVVNGNGGNVLVDPRHQTRLGSIYGMSPNSPFIQTLAMIPVVPGVHVHSIIPVRTSGPVAQGNDGVVRYSSAHIAGVDSELVVRSGHSTQANPVTIAEVHRILLLQLAASRTKAGAPVAALAKP